MSKNKIGFLWKRGNIIKEQETLYTHTVESELQGIDLYKLKSVFERVIKRKYKKQHEKNNPTK